MLRRLFECQIGALPEPASLMLAQDVHQDGQDHLSQQAAVTAALGLGDIDSLVNNGETPTQQNSDMNDEQDNLAIGIYAPQVSVEIDDVVEDANARGVAPVSSVPAEMAPALSAQQQLLGQIIALQQRYRPVSSNPIE